MGAYGCEPNVSPMSLKGVCKHKMLEWREREHRDDDENLFIFHFCLIQNNQTTRTSNIGHPYEFSWNILLQSNINAYQLRHLLNLSLTYLHVDSIDSLPCNPYE